MLGYICAKGRGKFHGRLVEQLVFIPYLIPSIAFGAIFLGMFSVKRGIIPSLYGIFALVVLVSVVKHFPFASRSQIFDHIGEAVEALYLPQGGLSLKAELNHDYSLEQMAAILDALEKYRHYKG